MSSEQKQRLSNASKQRLAREIGVNCQKITDVLDWMEKNCGNTKPVQVSVLYYLFYKYLIRNFEVPNFLILGSFLACSSFQSEGTEKNQNHKAREK